MNYLTKKETNLVFIFIIFITTLLIVLGIFNFKNKYFDLSKDILLKEAQAHYENMVNTRTWNAQYEGVYVLEKEGIKVNPYLKDNHIFTSDNKKLIRINPAWMTKQISTISNLNGDYYYKIISLKPINPANKADAFETEALTFFEKNKDKKFYYNFENESFNFMGSLITTESCLTCHAEQGYKLGDIRGGLRISIPTSTYSQNISLIEQNSNMLILIVIIISILTLVLLILFVNTIYKKQETIESLNKNLEKKVKKRTRELENLYENEKYLKDVLKLVADVNEMLVYSDSYKTITKNSIDKLIEHKNYTFIWTGFHHANAIEVIYKSQESNNILLDNFVFDDASDNLSMVALKAIKTNSTIIYKIQNDDIKFNRRDVDFNAAYNICIPYTYNNIKGVMSVFTDLEEGFKKEEVTMLEKIIADISTSLNTQAHKAEIIRMEDEKVSYYEETILAFVNIIEQRDRYTAGHTIRVAKYCRLIAQEVGIKEKDIIKLEQAAILHDIGKVAIPDSILLKPGRLNALEYELIKYHSEAGYQMLKKIDMYKDLAETIRYHHSRYDGKGYPETKSPDDIPFFAHIMIIADAFDAMTTNRIYKSRMSVEQALEEVKQGSGTQFHPELVIATLKSLKKVNIENANQLPNNELEKKRFAYFFHDSMTGLYNENYLTPVLMNESERFNYLYHIQQNNFSLFNKKHGWEEGNTIIKNISDFLLNKVDCEFIFRYHGDDFILLSDKTFDTKVLNLSKCIISKCVGC